MLSVLMVLTLAACGKEYICITCGEMTRKVYYGMAANESQVMCEDCAHQYWMPICGVKMALCWRRELSTEPLEVLRLMVTGGNKHHVLHKMRKKTSGRK